MGDIYRRSKKSGAISKRFIKKSQRIPTRSERVLSFEMIKGLLNIQNRSKTEKVSSIRCFIGGDKLLTYEITIGILLMKRECIFISIDKPFIHRSRGNLYQIDPYYVKSLYGILFKSCSNKKLSDISRRIYD